MADSKITALASIGTGTDPANDPLVIVDVSDILPGGMSLTGTTKKVTLNNLLSSSPTATGNFTITGDLTVDTSTLKVDSANDRVGIGLAAGINAKLHVSSTGSVHINQRTGNNGCFTQYMDPTSSNYVGTDSGNFRVANNIGQDLLNIQQLGVFTFGDGAGGTRMTLNSTGLGVGVVPSAGKGALQLSSGINFPATQVASSDANTLDDYEEGTFTPNITGTGVTGITYTTQSGVYTKIGRVVTFAINIAVSASTRAAAIFQIGNLPFSAAGSVAYGGIISYSDSGFFATAASNKPNLLISSTDVVFYKSDGSAFNGTDIAANAFAIRITGTYFTA